MAIFEFSDGFDAVGFFMEHPSAMDGDDYPEWDDVEADADTLASAGWGTDEDYGYYAEDAAMEYAWGDC